MTHSQPGSGYRGTQAFYRLIDAGWSVRVERIATDRVRGQATRAGGSKRHVADGSTINEVLLSLAILAKVSLAPAEG